MKRIMVFDCFEVTLLAGSDLGEMSEL
jgi:hypothetical protein